MTSSGSLPLVAVVLVPLLGVASLHESDAVERRAWAAQLDTSRVERALRHFYDLYTARDFETLYSRAHTRVRDGGMTSSNFRGFMTKKRDRLGPVRSMTVDVSGDASPGTVTAVATVTFEQGVRVERWQLVVEGESVQWRSFRTSRSSEGGDPGGSGTDGTPVRVGEEVPSFRVPGLRDSTRAFGRSDVRGRHVLLNFWATWCAPCIEQIPTYQTAVDRYGEAFTILNVSFDRTRADAIAFLDRRRLPGMHGFVGIRGFQGSLAQAFGIHGIPDPVLVGPNGVVVATREEIQEDGLLGILARRLDHK